MSKEQSDIVAQEQEQQPTVESSEIGTEASEATTEAATNPADLDKLSDEELLTMYRALPGRERNNSAAAFNFFPLIIALVVFLLDQYIKLIAVSTFKLNSQENRSPIPIVGDVFSFVYSENTGGAFSLLRDAPWLFTAFSTAIILVLLFVIFRYPRLVASSFWIGLGLGMVVGGASGNLVDRLRQGYVVDMLRFWWGDFHFPIFNIGDSGVVVGFIVLAIYGLTAGWFDGGAKPAKEARLWTVPIMTIPT